MGTAKAMNLKAMILNLKTTTPKTKKTKTKKILSIPSLFFVFCYGQSLY